MGETVAIRSAANYPDIAAVVAFYGGAGLAGEVDLLGRIGAPVLALWGDRDDLIRSSRSVASGRSCGG